MQNRILKLSKEVLPASQLGDFKSVKPSSNIVQNWRFTNVRLSDVIEFVDFIASDYDLPLIVKDKNVKWHGNALKTSLKILNHYVKSN